MNKTLTQRTVILSILFGLFFCIFSYFSENHASIGNVILRGIIATIVFALLYYTLFSILNSPERKYKFGITIPICLLLAILLSAIFSAIKVGIIVGLVIGVLAGYIWEWIEKRKSGGDRQ